ncbi:MAG: hypothetical protein DDT33_01406 [Firmicutes bacterium]|nr:MAG: HEPN domain-containing protein [Methanosarcinales archaeon Met12]MBT9132876.1 hypothetical protein [Bacillota bacterium]
MREEVSNWWKQALRDLESAKNALRYKDYYVSSFLSQQAVEKALKALYIEKYDELLRIHDIVFFAKKVGLPDDLIAACKRLNPVYAETRYPDASGKLPAYEYSKDDATNDLKDAEKVLTWIEKKT